MTTKRYKFTGERKTVDGVVLKQIIRLRDGAVGGWIKDQKCLPQGGSGWVLPSAMVCGGEMYDGEMRGGTMHGGVMTGGEMRGGTMYGGEIHKGMIVTRDPIYLILPKHHITVADNMAAVGCEVHDFAYWRKHIEEIGEKHRYSKDHIALYKAMLFAAMDEMEARNAEDTRRKEQTDDNEAI
jgi:hypothetical protein